MIIRTDDDGSLKMGSNQTPYYYFDEIYYSYIRM